MNSPPAKVPLAESTAEGAGAAHTVAALRDTAAHGDAAAAGVPIAAEAAIRAAALAVDKSKTVTLMDRQQQGHANGADRCCLARRL